MNFIQSKKQKLRARRIFMKKGSCSNTFFYILNREFGYPLPEAEKAVDPLAGGIIQLGYQCGMLWGASMALGAEAYRRIKDVNKASAVSIRATRHIMKSFEQRTKTIECGDFTKTDFKNKWSFTKYMISGKFLSCFKLAEKWAPEAVEVAKEALELETADSDKHCLSCAAEVVKKMGGSEEEQVMAAGFAGGLGLSGSGCGALSAAIWKITSELVKKGEWKYILNDPRFENVLNRFYNITDYEIECAKITDKIFDSPDDHTEYLINGGCKDLITELSKTKDT